LLLCAKPVGFFELFVPAVFGGDLIQGTDCAPLSIVPSYIMSYAIARSLGSWLELLRHFLPCRPRSQFIEVLEDGVRAM